MLHCSMRMAQRTSGERAPTNLGSPVFCGIQVGGVMQEVKHIVVAAASVEDMRVMFAGNPPEQM